MITGMLKTYIYICKTGYYTKIKTFHFSKMFHFSNIDYTDNILKTYKEFLLIKIVEKNILPVPT